MGPSWPCSYISWIHNYLCSQCLSPLILWVRISTRERCTTIWDKVCLWNTRSTNNHQSLYYVKKGEHLVYYTVCNADFVAVVVERSIAFAIFNVNNTFYPSHTLISKSLCDENRGNYVTTYNNIEFITVKCQPFLKVFQSYVSWFQNGLWREKDLILIYLFANNMFL